MKEAFYRVEKIIAGAALAAMAILPLSEILCRNLLSTGIPGSITFVQHLTLWVGFLGAALAAREGKLLALATGSFIPEGRFRRAAQIVSSAVDVEVVAEDAERHGCALDVPARPALTPG